MNLRQLAHFVAVAQTSNFTRAATRVHLTQSSLSSSIRALEGELGSDLFVRSTRRVELTEAGRALLPAAQRAIAAAQDGRDAVAGVRGLLRGQLAIGAIQTVGPVNIPASLARYHRRHPAVGLRLRHDGVPALVEDPHVAAVKMDARAAAVERESQRLGALGVDRKAKNRDGRSVVGQHAADRAADPAGTARYDGDPLFKW